VAVIADATETEAAATETAEPTTEATIPPTIEATAVPEVVEDTPVAPIDTIAAPAETAVPPTDTPPPPPTEAPTAVPPTNTPETAPAQPTIAYPNGRLIQLYYDSTSFYLRNGSSDRVDLRPIDFETIDANGTPLLYYFDGSQWTQFYTYVEEGRCDRIEIARANPWLRPPQCRGTNATVTPDGDSDLIFWIQQPGAARFRVLWNGAEIARCEFGAQLCEVYIP
jgi:hypothetical protein